MSIWDDIRVLRRNNRIPRQWKFADLRQHLTNPDTSLRSIPANLSVTQDGAIRGNSVKKGSVPKAWRIGPPGSGLYQLIGDPGDDAATQQAELELAPSLAGTDRGQRRSVGNTQKYINSVEQTTRVSSDIQIRPEETRWAITHEFARWATQSALRSGSPIKSRDDVYTALGNIDFRPLFDEARGPIDQAEFSAWHRNAISNLLETEPRLNAGWSAKIIAVYLKTSCYLAGFGREGLERVIHPPIDNILITNLRRRFRQHLEIYSGLATFRTISSLTTDDYESVIGSIYRIAQDEHCSLFEVERYFQPR